MDRFSFAASLTLGNGYSRWGTFCSFPALRQSTWLCSEGWSAVLKITQVVQHCRLCASIGISSIDKVQLSGFWSNELDTGPVEIPETYGNPWKSRLWFPGVILLPGAARSILSIDAIVNAHVTTSCCMPCSWHCLTSLELSRWGVSRLEQMPRRHMVWSRSTLPLRPSMKSLSGRCNG